MGEAPVKVTLLIGEKQRRLELDLVRQIHEHADKVTLVEVGASGRNALDLVLAWHLGATVERHPNDAFFVISRDKDYDPLIRHLHSRGLEVARVESFSALPFIARTAPAARTPSPRRGAGAPANSSPTPVPRRADRVAPAPVEPPAETSSAPAESDPRLAKLIRRLEHGKDRPVRRKTLLSHINGFFANQLSQPELEAIAATLQDRGIIRIGNDGRVAYPTHPVPTESL